MTHLFGTLVHIHILCLPVVLLFNRSPQDPHNILIFVNTHMCYILLIDKENSMEFWVYNCAVIYQSILGGEIYAINISRSADPATDTAATQLAS